MMHNQLQALVEKWREEVLESAALSRCADELAALLAQREAHPATSPESVYVTHARIQGAADGFQKGWHAALARVRECGSFDELAELERLVPSPSQWQPIETAPQGIAVLVYRPKSVKRERVAIRVATDWCGHSCCPRAEPTHWMPLPAPPESR